MECPCECSIELSDSISRGVIYNLFNIVVLVAPWVLEGSDNTSALRSWIRIKGSNLKPKWSQLNTARFCTHSLTRETFALCSPHVASGFEISASFNTNTTLPVHRVLMATFERMSSGVWVYIHLKSSSSCGALT